MVSLSIPEQTLWAGSYDRNKPPGTIVNAVLLLRQKCAKVENLQFSDDFHATKNHVKWDFFEQLLQYAIFAIQIILLAATHSKLY